MLQTFVSDLAVVDPGVELGNRVQIWHFTHIREGVTVGDETNIGSHCYIDAGVRIGRKCKIQSGCLIYRPAVIGDGVFVGPGVKIINDKTPRAVDANGNKLTDGDWLCEGVLIEDGASIGTGAILMPGIIIGSRAVIGAGSIVMKDVEPGAEVYGVAANSR